MFSVLEGAYKFADQGVEDIRPLDAKTLGALRVAAALLPLLVHRAGQGFDAVYYFIDSSHKGCALHYSVAMPAEIEGVGNVREKWRFRPPVRTPGEQRLFAMACLPAC
jgi:hypothetical protein